MELETIRVILKLKGQRLCREFGYVDVCKFCCLDCDRLLKCYAIQKNGNFAFCERDKSRLSLLCFFMWKELEDLLEVK